MQCTLTRASGLARNDSGVARTQCLWPRSSIYRLDHDYHRLVQRVYASYPHASALCAILSWRYWPDWAGLRTEQFICTSWLPRSRTS
jgi:hypothetical protein